MADAVDAMGILLGSGSTLWTWHSVASVHHSQQEAELFGKSAAWCDLLLLHALILTADPEAGAS